MAVTNIYELRYMARSLANDFGERGTILSTSYLECVSNEVKKKKKKKEEEEEEECGEGHDVVHERRRLKPRPA
ncbi:unnamed protein product [Nippostrongylus brasiliensis]|uniref:Uncharacterized protein n=1 Tax=Nippostrongylus brasiliensis TaxID=27835 RepID=A0A0N4YBV9_NIPBR|nr:unnamed protein product [Nippostrongylus brasiliensis]